MRRIFILFLFFILNNNAFADDFSDKVKVFWNYISKNEIEIFRINNPRSPFYTEIFNQIQLVDKNIYVMVSNEPESNKKNLIVTANGNHEYFDLCDRIVNIAPKYVHLNVISLFPSLEKIEPFIFGENIFSVEDINVHFDSKNNKFDLLFLLNEKHLSIIKNNNTGYFYIAYMQMIYTMLQQILGERIVGEKINSVDISLVNLLPNIPLIEIKRLIK
jgi:hypothetical protein